MTAARIFRTAKPVTGHGRVLPMSDADAEFWRLRKAMPTERRGFLARLFRRV